MLPSKTCIDFSTEMNNEFIESAHEGAIVLADGTILTHIARIWPKQGRTSNGIIESYGIDSQKIVCVKFCIHNPPNFQAVLETLSETESNLDQPDFYTINLACIPAEVVCGGAMFIMPFCIGSLADPCLAASLYKRGLDKFSAEIAATCASMIRRNLVFSDLKADNILVFNSYSPNFKDKTTNYSLYICDLETFDTLSSSDLMGCTYPLQKRLCRTTSDLVLLNMAYSFLLLVVAVWSIANDFAMPFQSLSHGFLSNWSDNYSFESPKHKYWTLIDLYGDARPEEIRHIEIETKSTLIDMVRLSPARRIDRAIQHFDCLSGNNKEIT